MKKYLFYSLLVAMLGCMSFALTACGDDDEPDGGKGGKVSFAYEGAITETLSVEEATWCPRSQTVIGTGHYDLDEGATFAARFGDDENFNVAYLQFQTRDAVVKGQDLNVDSEALFFNSPFEVRHQEIGGTVKVKSISGDEITLEFKNFSFLRETNSGNTQKVTVNGSITYELED